MYVYYEHKSLRWYYPRQVHRVLSQPLYSTPFVSFYKDTKSF